MKIEPDSQLAIDRSKLENILQEYNLKLLSYSETSTGIENKTIITNTDNGKYVIRVYRQNKKDDHAISKELDFVKYLRDHNIPTPKVLTNSSRQQITKLTFGDRSWQIILMEYATGIHPGAYTAKLISEMAKIQATMHTLSGMYTATDLSKETLRTLRETYFIQQIKTARITNPELKDFLGRAASYTLDLSTDLPLGLCHLDFDRENLLVNNDSVTAVLDFDDLAVAPFVVCLAYTMWHIYVNIGPDATRQYLTDYKSNRHITEQEQSYIKPIMLFRHYMISTLNVLNNHTSGNDIKKYLVTEEQLSTQQNL